MKKVLLIGVICAGCVQIGNNQELAKAERTKEVAAIVEVLETERDPIKAITAYETYCDCQTVEDKPTCRCHDLLIMPGGKPNCMDYFHADYSLEECVSYRESVRPTDGRRANHSQIGFRDIGGRTEIGLFDYKRFLPENSPIQSEDAFVRLVARYDGIHACENMNAADVIQECKDKIIREVNLVASERVDCAQLEPYEYTRLLRNRGQWYKWAINHDPKKTPYELSKASERALARFDYEEFSRLSEAATFAWNNAYHIILPKSVAKNKVSNDIQNFGIEHLCTTENWERDMKKLGYAL